MDIESLRKTELFAALDEPDSVLQAFADVGEERMFEDEEVVFAEMADSDEIYLVVEGVLNHTFALAEAGAELEDFPVGPGEISNAVRLFADGPSFVSCVAVGSTKVIAWKAEDWRTICERHPETGYRLVTRVARIFYQRFLTFNKLLLDNLSWGLD